MGSFFEEINVILTLFWGIPLERKRSLEKSREINRKWADLSTVQYDLSGIRPIYAARDLYDACKSAIDESHSSGDTSDNLPLGDMPARVPLQSFSDAKSEFWDISEGIKRLAIDLGT